MFLRQVGETLALQKAFDQGDVPIDGRAKPPTGAESFQHHSVCSSGFFRPLQTLPGQIGAWKTRQTHVIMKQNWVQAGSDGDRSQDDVKPVKAGFAEMVVLIKYLK
ncbi:hypothetical protein [Mesorhizobium sp.]|uniref:hypothetical protein n=1 Tax=Mesorhizobium sp. TaxID=1871066 RepID=UPI0025BC5853|nr:hypothetical protein [Mesorhizobium sp.]